jgi:hypothetical protein
MSRWMKEKRRTETPEANVMMIAAQKKKSIEKINKFCKLLHDWIAKDDWNILEIL